MTEKVLFEKYKPLTLDELVIPETLRVKIRGYLEGDGYNLPHLGLFSRQPGTGKSSLAKIIINTLEAECIWINASKERSIDTLRGKIQMFCSQKPLRDTIKIVVMDEFDNFSIDGQSAFRGFLDEFTDDVRFIFTGNYTAKILEPLLNRMTVYEFDNFSRQEILPQIAHRLKYILDSEGIAYEKADLVSIVKDKYPSIRAMIGAIDRYSVNGELKYQQESFQDQYNAIIEGIREQNFDVVRSKCYSMEAVDPFYSYVAEHMDGLKIPKKNHINVAIILGKYSYQSSTVRDKHLNLLACVAELFDQFK